MSAIALDKSIDREATLLAVEKRICEESLHAFIRRAWHIVEPGQPFVDNWHIEYICDHLMAITDEHELEGGKPYNRLLINVPPGMMKSLIVNVFWPAWEWGPCDKPHLRYICAAHTQNLAIRDSTKMRRLILSDWYQRHWGHIVKLTGDQNAKTKFENTATGFREAIAAGSITGSRGDRVLCFSYDEIVHTENGSLRIGDIVKNQLKVRVWSSRPGSGRAELKDIYDWKHNPGSEILEITLSDGSSFKCTPDHKIWTSSGWIPAGMLSSSHIIPRQSVPDSPDSSRRDAVHGRKKSLRSIGAVNFKNLFGGKFSPAGSLSSKIVVFLSNRICKFFPSFTASNLLDCRALYPETLREDFGGLITAGYNGSLFSRENGARPLFVKRKRTMTFSVRYIFGARPVFKIAQSGIKVVPVFVSNLLSGKRRSNECEQNGLMNKHRLGNPINACVKSWVSLASGCFKNLFRNIERSPVLAKNNAGLTAYAPKIAYAVQSLETNDRFPVLVRKVGHVNETFCLSVKDNHSFFVGSGKGVLVSNCDDPHSVEGANSDAMRASTLEWFTEAVPTRLNNPRTSAIVVIKQRLHEEDVSGIILERKGFAGTYDHICLPMRFESWRKDNATWLGYTDPREEEGELLFPERFPMDVVDDLEGKLGPYATAGQHQQAPTPRGGGIIKDAWWQPYEEAEFPPLEYVIASLDTAYSTKAEERGDYSAMTIWGVFQGDGGKASTKTMDRYGRPFEAPVASIQSQELGAVPRLMLMHAWSERLDLHSLITKVVRDCKAFKVDKILIENKAAGHSVAQELRRLFGYEDFAVHLYDPKSIDKLARLYSVQHIFAEGMVFAPDKHWAEEVIRQVSSFPRGKHDDLVDTVSMALRHLRELGLLTRSPERMAEIDRSKRHEGRPPAPLYEV